MKLLPWLSFLCFCAFSGIAFAQTFQNPVRLSAPDPWAVHHKGYYYLTYTAHSHIEVVRAESLSEIRDAKAIVVFRSDDGNIGHNIWAPELHRLKGPNGVKWYLYYSAGPDPLPTNQRNHVLESIGDDPLGPYKYKSRIFDPAHDVYAIDAHVLKKPNGTLYFLYSTNDTSSIRIAPMKNPWTLAGSGVEISTPKYPWEKIEGNTNEGPEVLHRNGKYWLIHSGNSCHSGDYALGMLYADENSNLLDPKSWTKHPTPIFSKNEKDGVFGPGHNGFFRTPSGEDWIVYHAVTNPEGECNQTRSARAQRFTWNSDGSPNFGLPHGLEKPLRIPTSDPIVRYEPVVPTSELVSQPWKYSFKVLDPNWFEVSFDDSKWLTGKGGFGSLGTPGSSIRTLWQSPSNEIWLRKEFDISHVSRDEIKNLVLRIHHDEEVNMYVNGVLAASLEGYSTKYFFEPIFEQALNALTPSGRNVVAVYCKQTVGGQYIDVGLYLRTSR